jgi:hypothetical protein
VVPRVLARVLAGVVLTLAVATLQHAPVAQADAAFVATGHSPTQGTPVPGSYVTADLGTWTTPPDPDGYEFEWLRDGTSIPGATARDYLVQVADVGHQLEPFVIGHSGSDSAHFFGTAVTVRKLESSVSLDVRRVHPAPGRARLVWSTISVMSTERPWPTDGGMVTAYRKKDGLWRQLGSTVVTRSAAVVRLPWKRVPFGRTKVRACFQGSDAVAVSCSTPHVVRRQG